MDIEQNSPAPDLLILNVSVVHLNTNVLSMNQFFLRQGESPELRPFPQIVECALRKNNSIQFNSFVPTTTETLRLYYILDGKFEWMINGERVILYPFDLAIVQAGQRCGSERGYLDIGSLSWIHLRPELAAPGEMTMVQKILSLNTAPVISNFREAGAILQSLKVELINQHLGYQTRVNQLVDDLLIQIARMVTRQNSQQRDFPQAFLRLENNLRKNLSHQWTVDEMAALVGLGATAFTEKVKNYTGFSPLNYLINIRISEAIRLLKRREANVTEIALETGFYSSQHFATTFKKLTGYTPSQFRKNNTQNESS